jgi:Concanavalin A-like lectin/glucanases superfamily
VPFPRNRVQHQLAASARAVLHGQELLDWGRVTWPASLHTRRELLLLALTCHLLGACTEPRSDNGPSDLPLRQIEDSGHNYALVFDGVQQYATTGTADFPRARYAQTLSVRFMVDTISGKHAFLTLRKDFDSGVEFGINNGFVSAWRVHGGEVLATATTPVSTGVWHHAAYLFEPNDPINPDDTGIDHVYVDGVAAPSGVTGLIDRRTPTTCWLGTLDGTRDLFQGKLDNVLVFKDYVIAAAGDGAPSETALVLNLPFNEDPDNLTVFDHSSRANDGRLGDGIEQHAPTRILSTQ